MTLKIWKDPHFKKKKNPHNLKGKKVHEGSIYSKRLGFTEENLISSSCYINFCLHRDS